MRNSRLHFLALAIATVVTLIGRVSLRESHSQEHREIQRRGREARSKEFISVWNSLVFNSTEAGISVNACTSSVDWGASGLSSIQQQRAPEAIGKAITFLICPTLEAYIAFKCEGFEVQRSLTYETYSALRSVGFDRDHIYDASPNEVLTNLWSTIARTSGISKLTAVDHRSFQVSVAHQNSVESLLTGKVRKRGTLTDRMIDTGIRYPSSGVTPQYLHVSLFARADSSTNAGPIHMSFFWTSEGKWAPTMLLADASLNFKVLF